MASDNPDGTGTDHDPLDGSDFPERYLKRAVFDVTPPFSFARIAAIPADRIEALGKNSDLVDNGISSIVSGFCP